MSQGNQRETGKSGKGFGRKVLWIIGGIVVLVVIVLPAIPFYIFHLAPKKLITPEMMASYRIENEEARLGKLLALPEGPGNGAEDLWSASHQKWCGQGKGDCKPHYAWMEQVTWELLKSDQPEDQNQLREWSRIQEVDVFRRAAGKKDFKFLGTVVFPTPGVHPMETAIPYYLDYPRLARLGVVRSRELEAQGNTEAALAWLLDMMRIAHQMEKDILISQMVGIAIKIPLSEEIAKFYERQGQAQLAQAWKDYGAETEKRKALYRDTLGYFSFFSEADAKKIVEDPKVFTSFRNEFYMFLAARMCYSDPWRFYLGPTASDQKYLFADHSEDPLFITMQLICAPEVKAGFFHRLHSGARAYYYTFMQKPTPPKNI